MPSKYPWEKNDTKKEEKKEEEKKESEKGRRNEEDIAQPTTEDSYLRGGRGSKSSFDRMRDENKEKAMKRHCPFEPDGAERGGSAFCRIGDKDPTTIVCMRELKERDKIPPTHTCSIDGKVYKVDEVRYEPYRSGWGFLR